MSAHFTKCLTVAAVVLVAACSAPAEDEEDAVGSEGALNSGRRLSEAEIAGLLRDADFPEHVVATMVCTAKYESSYFEGAIGKRNGNGTIDRGLFQINSVHLGDRGCPRTVSGMLK